MVIGSLLLVLAVPVVKRLFPSTRVPLETSYCPQPLESELKVSCESLCCKFGRMTSIKNKYVEMSKAFLPMVLFTYVGQSGELH